MNLPQLGTSLTTEQLELVQAVSQSCRHSIIKMVTNAQSGHPGGSLSTIDYLATLYTFIINQTNNPVVVSNGHISPAVYSILGELGATSKERAINNFRKANDIYEGHINRAINGVWYGTGPLGIGSSVASGLAYAAQLSKSNEHIYLIMGDGESQEGQVYEMMHFAHKYKLSNLTLFIDYNEVQLTASLEEIMPINLAGHYEAAGWHVINIDGHDHQAIWQALHQANQNTDQPTCIIGKTIMGKGVSYMEETGLAHKADWHGKSPSPEMGEAAAKEVEPTKQQMELIKEFLQNNPSKIKTVMPTIEHYHQPIANVEIGEHRILEADVLTDCRSAYGNALGDLAALNPNLLALTADLEESVKTGSVKKVDQLRHIECGIAEQHMVSTSGGLSIANYIPFCSTFGAFMSSRAKDQARVNDINHTNVKMVATHCGLSVGEDGPTHQAIDDISSFTGFFNTHIFEPADPNQTDHIIRFITKTFGNYYVRMGRAKTPIITKADGTPFYDKNYKFTPGQADILRTGTDLTIIASGPMVAYALKAQSQLEAETKASIEVIAVSSFAPFDQQTINQSLDKTGKAITIHDHNLHTGLLNFVQQSLGKAEQTAKIIGLGVKEYQLSGTADELYKKAGMDITDIKAAAQKLLG